MGNIKEPLDVHLFCGLIYNSAAAVEQAETLLCNAFGTIALRSQDVPFDKTDYYHKEMGTRLIRRLLSFTTQIHPGDLAAIKVKTNAMEEQLASDGKRTVNIDPGYVELSKVVLASTKNYSHRIYIGNGIYAEVTLIYKHGAYTVLEWTYPDYKTEMFREFFKKVRGCI